MTPHPRPGRFAVTTPTVVLIGDEAEILAWHREAALREWLTVLGTLGTS